MGCSGSKSTRVKAVIGGRHKALTALLKSAEKLRDTVPPLATAFDGNVAAVAAWAAEEESKAIRDSGTAVKESSEPVIKSIQTLRDDIEKFVQAFSRIMALENELDTAERELTKAQRTGERAEEKLKKNEEQGLDTMQAQIDVNLAQDAIKAAKEKVETKMYARNTGRESNFQDGMRDFTAAISRHYSELAATFEAVGAVAESVPEQPDKLEAEQDIRPRGQSSMTSAGYKKLKSATRSFDKYAKAQAELGKAMKVVFVKTGQWGEEAGDLYSRRCSEVSEMAPIWEAKFSQFVASIAAACSAFAEIEAFEKQIDGKWKLHEEAEKVVQRETKKQAKLEANPTTGDQVKAEAQLAVDNATTAREEALTNVRTERDSVAALKHSNYRSSLANTAESHVTLGKAVVGMFDGLAATLERMKQVASVEPVIDSPSDTSSGERSKPCSAASLSTLGDGATSPGAGRDEAAGSGQTSPADSPTTPPVQAQ